VADVPPVAATLDGREVCGELLPAPAPSVGPNHVVTQPDVRKVDSTLPP
jgi:hypothetical protein